jgi:hypothetical protein
MIVFCGWEKGNKIVKSVLLLFRLIGSRSDPLRFGRRSVTVCTISRRFAAMFAWKFQEVQKMGTKNEKDCACWHPAIIAFAATVPWSRSSFRGMTGVEIYKLEIIWNHAIMIKHVILRGRDHILSCNHNNVMTPNYLSLRKPQKQSDYVCPLPGCGAVLQQGDVKVRQPLCCCHALLFHTLTQDTCRLRSQRSRHGF